MTKDEKARVREKSWATTVILGGGRSAANLNIPELRRLGFVLLLNKWARYVQGDGVCSHDRSRARKDREWWEPYGKEAHCLGYVADDTLTELDLPLLTRWKQAPDGRPTLEPGMVGTGPYATMTGYGAMNLAAQRGAQWIMLLGYDMDPANLHAYPHDRGEEYPFQPLPYREEALQQFEEAAPWYRDHGIRVTVVGESALRGYERMVLEEVLHELERRKA